MRSHRLALLSASGSDGLVSSFFGGLHQGSVPQVVRAAVPEIRVPSSPDAEALRSLLEKGSYRSGAGVGEELGRRHAMWVPAAEDLSDGLDKTRVTGLILNLLGLIRSLVGAGLVTGPYVKEPSAR